MTGPHGDTNLLEHLQNRAAERMQEWLDTHPAQTTAHDRRVIDLDRYPGEPVRYSKADDQELPW